jgi:hypothetical protein
LEMVQYHAKLLAQYLGASHKAHGHGWIAAVDQMQTRVSETLRQLQSATSEAVIHSQRPPILRPTLRDLHQDLLQLHQEFEEVTLDLKGGIVIAVTDAIQLEDVYLGPFRLELHLDRLAERAEVSVFDVVALDPHPPASSEDVTHPHVRDNQLCAGEATAPIAHALREGRICDAFLAVNSVLHTYNVHSPFVSLSDWEGVPCADCGYATSEDQRYYCEDCGQDFCEECYSTCDICQTSCCRGCLWRRIRNRTSSAAKGAGAIAGDVIAWSMPTVLTARPNYVPVAMNNSCRSRRKKVNPLRRIKMNNKTQIRARRSPLCQTRHEEETQVLTFSPMAWLKLRLFLHADDVEVGGFGISSDYDLLYIEDFVTVKQFVSPVTVEFDDGAVADHFDSCADADIPPARCGRIWVHTHPGTSPIPSYTDQQTFRRVFGNCDWAVMAIVARGGASYARLRFRAGPGGDAVIPIGVDWERFPLDLLDHEGKLDDQFTRWMDEYGRNVHHKPLFELMPKPVAKAAVYRDPLDELDELYDQQILMDDFPQIFEAPVPGAFAWEDRP